MPMKFNASKTICLSKYIFFLTSYLFRLRRREKMLLFLNIVIQDCEVVKLTTVKGFGCVCCQPLYSVEESNPLLTLALQL